MTQNQSRSTGWTGAAYVSFEARTARRARSVTGRRGSGHVSQLFKYAAEKPPLNFPLPEAAILHCANRWWDFLILRVGISEPAGIVWQHDGAAQELDRASESGGYMRTYIDLGKESRCDISFYVHEGQQA